MKFNDWLNEKRRNPELNPKIGVVEALTKHKDRQDVFIQYSEINKLGLNPKSGFSTPLGIYTYPLKQIWNEIIDNKVPFAANRKYVIVFSCAHPLLQEADEYNDYMLNKDLGFYKKEIFEKWEEYILPIKNYYSNVGEYFEKFKKNAFKTAFNKHPFMRFWNFTRLLSNDISMRNIPKYSNDPMKIWGSLIRARNYVGFTDRKGRGFIHPNEPVQAVFFSTSNTRLIEVLLNRRYIEEVRTNIGITNFYDIEKLIIENEFSYDFAIEQIVKELCIHGEMDMSEAKIAKKYTYDGTPLGRLKLRHTPVELLESTLNWMLETDNIKWHRKSFLMAILEIWKAKKIRSDFVIGIIDKMADKIDDDNFKPSILKKFGIKE